jgi:hypothetical protein
MKNKVIFYVILSLLSIIATLQCYTYAVQFRAVDVVGGEIGLLLIPFIVWMGVKIYKDDKKWRENDADFE